MKELSLNILDIAENSVRAGATTVRIEIEETDTTLTFTVSDDGCGMKPDFLAKVTDPFATTRKTRKVGLGIPFLKMAAEMTGGYFDIKSKSEEDCEDHGTQTTAMFHKDSIDYIPLGNIVETVCTLIHGADNIDYEFTHRMPGGTVQINTRDMREMLGDDIPLSSLEVIDWLRGYLTEAYKEVSN